MRHNMIKKRIDGRGEEVENAADVVKDAVRGDHVVGATVAVDGEETLRVKRRPADEERHHHSDWNTKRKMRLSSNNQRKTPA